MAFEEGNGTSTTMLVQPSGYGGYNGGMFGGDFGWFILAALIFGGWGGMGFGGMGGWGMGGFGGMYEFPWLLNGQNQINANTNAGFDHAATQAAIGDLSGAVTSGFGDVQTALCGGFAGVSATVNGAANGITNRLYDNEIASLNRSFAVESALQNCCCENRAAIADVKYTIASEGCATRATSTANTQAILDKLCQLELDGVKAQVEAKNDVIAQLRQENLYARGQASQIAQNQQIIDGLYNRLDSCPVGTTPVYGRTAIFSCNNNGGCSCGNGFAN